MQAQQLDWVFQKSQGHQGINPLLDSAFKRNDSVVREIIQNSLDAAIEDSSDSVRVEFELLEWPFTYLPNHERLKEVINNVIKDNSSVDQLEPWLSKASECLNKNPLPVLRVSDFSTTGLEGHHDHRDTLTYTFIYGDGISQGAKNRGGSFGFGKAAHFCSSDLRTCFYRSCDRGGSSVFFGKTMLPSFDDLCDDKKVHFGGSGYWGMRKELSPTGFNDDFYPVTDLDLLKGIWRDKARTKSGLDIYIIGYSHNASVPLDKWHDPLINYVLRNFWASIYFNKLEVVFLRGSSLEIKINQRSLDTELIKRKENEELKSTYRYYQAVKDNPKPDNCLEGSFGYWQQELSNGIGEAKLYLKVDNESQEYEKELKKVARMRLPKMLIEEKPYSSPVDYAGVFICDNKQGNKLLRSMEPVCHDKWAYTNSNEYNAKTAISEVNKFIGQCVKELKPSPQPQDAIAILANVFYYPKEGGDEPGEPSNRNDSLNVRALAVPGLANMMLLIIRQASKRDIKGDYRLTARDDNGHKRELKIKRWKEVDSEWGGGKIVELVSKNGYDAVEEVRNVLKQKTFHYDKSATLRKLVIKPNSRCMLLVELTDSCKLNLVLDAIPDSSKPKYSKQ